MLLVLVVRPITTLLHELGHAIPAFLLTRQKVSVYIGSHGDPAKSLHLRVGLLEFWLRYNPLSWYYGLCHPRAEQISTTKKFIYTLTGPLASITIAIVACYFSFVYDVHGALKLLLIVFLGSSVFDLFVNLIPNRTPFQLFDGTVVYNDGYQLRQLVAFSKNQKEYREAEEAYEQQDFERVAKLTEHILSRGFRHEIIYRLGIVANIHLKRYTTALALHDKLDALTELTNIDHHNLGLIYAYLDRQQDALNAFDHGIHLDPNNSWAYNNRGYFLTVWHRFDEALHDLNKALEIDPDFAFALSNRGLAKIKLGDAEAGLADINRSIEIDAENSYAWRNLGIYHLTKGNKPEALKLFEKAKQLDADTLLLDDLISEATQ